MVKRWKAISLGAAVAVVAVVGAVAGSLLLALALGAGGPPNTGAEHHTVTVHCSAAVCTGGRMTIATSDGGVWDRAFSVANSPPVTFTFTGLAGGANALDLALPVLNCEENDTVTIPMGPGASVSSSGGYLGTPMPTAFTVPSNVAAVFTAKC